MKVRSIILLIALLVGLDQAVKLLIYQYFMDVNFEIIPRVLDFKPFFNSKYSFVNHSIHKGTGMDAGLIFHVVLFALIWLIVFVFYRFYKRVAPTNKMLDISFSLLTAGVLCAYLGILVWKEGVLDFLQLKPFGKIVFDLKDLYINCFVVCLLISTKRIESKHHIKLKDMADYLKGLFGGRA